MPLLLDRKRADEVYLRELVDFLGLGERLTHLPHGLSGGQQQRVAIARALIAKPDVIFADEPTGNLDSKSGGEVMRMLCDIRERLDKTLVIITHDSKLAAMADRRFTIEDGVLSISGMSAVRCLGLRESEQPGQCCRRHICFIQRILRRAVNRTFGKLSTTLPISCSLQRRGYNITGCFLMRWASPTRMLDSAEG